MAFTVPRWRHARLYGQRCGLAMLVMRVTSTSPTSAGSASHQSPRRAFLLGSRPTSGVLTSPRSCGAWSNSEADNGRAGFYAYSHRRVLALARDSHGYLSRTAGVERPPTPAVCLYHPACRALWAVA